MQKIEIRKQTALSVLNVEHLPAIPDEKLELAVKNGYPIANLQALGVGFEPLTSAIQSITSHGSAGGSGIYRVDTMGLQMFRSKQGNAFIGSLQTAEGTVGGGQALMTPLACDPTMLFMAATLMNVEKKLNAIHEMQEEMMDFLKVKEKARLRGDLNVLNDIISNYKFNWNNDKYKTNKHILVQDIRKDSEESIQLSRDQIQKKLAKKSFLHADQKVKNTLQKLQAEFRDYQQALYLFAYSAFMEIMLLENFDQQYLNSVATRIEEYAFQFRQIYTQSYDQIESMSKASVESKLTKGFADIAKGTGKALAKIPLVNTRPIDDALISAGEKIDSLNERKTQRTMQKLVDAAANSTTPFVENIRALDRVYNKPMELLFDKDMIYFLESPV